MHFLVYGAGAVGGYVGLSLALGGHPVSFIGRPRLVDSVHQGGFFLRQAGADQHLTTEAVYPTLAAALAEVTPDLILLTVKAYDCASAAVDIAGAEVEAPVISLINGVGSEAILSDHLGANRVIAGTVTTAVSLDAPNRVRVRRPRGIGLASDHPSASGFARALAEAGIPVTRYDNPAAMKWSKLLTNLTANACAAITGLTAAEIYRHPGLYRLELQSLREAIRTIGALGLTIRNLPGVAVRPLAWAIRLPPAISQPLLRRAIAGGRGGKRPSMYYDVERGRTEVNWLNGAVAEQAERLGLSAPANRTLTELVRELAAEPSSAAARRLSPAALLSLAEERGVQGL